MTNSNITDFWIWFQEHLPKFNTLIDSRSAFWQVALNELKRIDNGLWFELSEPDDGIRDFVITVEGDVELFSLVENIIAQAPRIAGWQFTALKPVMGFDFVTRYEGIDFDPRKMWFLPLKNASRLQDLGLKIAIPNFRPKKARAAFNAVEIILETALGERVAAEEIQHLEIVSLPSSPAEQGFFKLPELSDYIVWHNKQSVSTND